MAAFQGEIVTEDITIKMPEMQGETVSNDHVSIDTEEMQGETVSNDSISLEIEEMNGETESTNIGSLMPELSQFRKICRVRTHIRHGQDSSVYDPVVLSLGPYHHGKSQLQQMEVFKKMTVNKMLDNGPGPKNKEFYMRKILQRIRELRNNYEEIDCTDEVLAEMMFYDASFLIYCITTVLYADAYEEMIRGIGWCNTVFVFRDFHKLENQIPLWVIWLLIQYHLIGNGEQLIGRFLIYMLVGLDDNNEDWNAHFHHKQVVPRPSYKPCNPRPRPKACPVPTLRPPSPPAPPSPLLPRPTPFSVPTLRPPSPPAPPSPLLPRPPPTAPSASQPRNIECRTPNHRTIWRSIKRTIWRFVERQQQQENDNIEKRCKLFNNVMKKNPLHLLEAIQLMCLSQKKEMRRQPTLTGWKSATSPMKWYEKYNIPFHSATYLQSKGIYFRPSSHWITDIRFTSHSYYGELHLPIRFINNNTKMFFNNVIAFEMSPGQFTWSSVTNYVDFMRSLIEDPNDVKLLRESGILFTDLGSDGDVVEVFRKIETYGSIYSDMFEDVKVQIKQHCCKRRKTWIADLLHTYFRNPWTAIGLFAAIFVLCLTFLQTFFTIRPTSK